MTIHDLPDFSDDRTILKAKRVDRDLYSTSDLVIAWSTDAGPYDLIMRCPPVVPDLLPKIEIIADEEVFMGDDSEGLLDKLKDRSLVRFNAATWSVIWMAETKTESAQIQAVFRQLPNAMIEMVRQTAAGRLPERVDEFFEHLRAALAA
ncbi:MAG: hypothetical protein LC775_14900 [Acidobacteria bacterium]|nr:hypothetical protein [Acidobacteriota bacterium]